MVVGGAFGEQMMTNLRLRGCPPIGAASSAKALHERLQGSCGVRGAHGWPPWSPEDGGGAVSMTEAIARVLDPSDWARARSIEPLDELEEFLLLQAHYCLAWRYIRVRYPPTPPVPFCTHV